MAYEIGTAFIQIVPSFDKIEGALREGAKDMVDRLDKTIGDALPKGVKKASRNTSRAAEELGDEAGEAFAGHFADTLQQRLQNMLKSIAKLDIDATPMDRKLIKLRKDIEGFAAEAASLNIEIDDKTALDEAKKLRDRLDRALNRLRPGQFQHLVDLSQARDNIQAWIEVVEAGGEQAAQAVRRSVQEQDRIHQQAIDEDLRRERKAAAERSRLHADAIEEDLRREYQARQEMARLHEEALAENAKRDRKAAAERFDRTLAGQVRKNLTDLYQSLPALEITVDSSNADVALRGIRDDLQGLARKTVGVDVDAAQAQSQLAAIRSELQLLSNVTTDVQVRVDALAAIAELEKVERTVAQLDGRDVNIDVDGSGLDDVARAASVSLSRLEQLIAVSVSLGTILVPAAAAAAGAIGFIGTAAASAAAGAGVMALGFTGIGDAVKALNKQQLDAVKSANSVAAAEDRVASATDAVTSAQRSLANTRANAAVAARRAAQQVADAQRAVTDARREAAEAIKQAAERVVGAEEDLTRAQVEARAAREGLTEAYRDAKRALDDLDSSVKRNALDQRQATLDITEAREELDKILTNPRATEEEREQARITYERRLQQLRDLQRQGKQLAADQVDANRKGVEGSDQVVAARKRIADADRRVTDAQRALQTAREAVNRAQVDGARRVADAQRRVGEAQQAQLEQQRQSSVAIAQAQQSVISAQRQLQKAFRDTATAGGESMQNLRQAMDNLSPAGQRFARFIFSLKDEFDSLRTTAQENLLPGVQKSIETLLPFLPSFRDYVGDVAQSIGDLFAETTRFLTTDATWRRFWDHMSDETVPTMERLYRIGRNVATGLLGLYLAFTPFNEPIGGGLEDLTERFAEWSAQLENDTGFQRLLGYIRDNAPLVLHALGQLATFVARFVQASAPTGTYVLRAFTALVELLNAIPLPVLQTLVTAMSFYATALLAVNTASRLAAINQAVMGRAVLAGRNALGLKTATVLAYTTAVERANTKAFALNRTMGALAGSAGVARAGWTGLVNLLGGPLQAALTGATVMVVGIASAHADYKGKVDSLATALGLLADRYKELTASGKAAAGGVDEQLRGIIKSNPEMQKMLVILGELGIGFEQFARASTGSAEDMDAVLAAIDTELAGLGDKWQKEFLKFWEPGTAKATHDRMQELRQLKDAFIANANALGVNQRAQELMNASQKRANDLEQIFGNFYGPISIQRQQELTNQYDRNEARIRELTAALAGHNNEQAWAAQRADAFTRAIEQQTGAAERANEAEETWSQSLIDLRASVDTNGRSLDLHSQAGLRNRDALEAAAAKARELWLEDIRSGKPMADATKAHNDRIAALREEARKAGLNKTETDKLIATYGKVPGEVKTDVKTKGFEEAYEELARLQFMQFALKEGLNPKAAAATWNAKKMGGYAGSARLFKAEGGPIPGHSPSDTADNIPIWATAEEFMVRRRSARRMQRVHPGALDYINKHGELPGYAAGGPVIWPFVTTAQMTRIPSTDEARAAVFKNTAGRSSGGIGSADMMRILRAVFPGLPLMSGYRPGSRTNSGALSYHARIAADGDKGRAVDVPPRWDVFNWIRRSYPDSRELIFTPAGGLQIWNGRPHVFQDPFVRKTHYNHVHWAYDQGGFLPPGVSTVVNNTGQPEPVFTAAQWDQLATVIRQNRDGSNTVAHHWHFKEAALDHGRLQAWQDRQDALARVGRPR